MESQPGGGSAPRRFLTQRPGLSVRSLHPLPRVGIRLPHRSPSPLTSSAPGVASIRLQTPGAQGTNRSEGNPSPLQTVQDTGGRGGLQDQIQGLGSEVRSLGLAVKMLVEQQCRLLVYQQLLHQLPLTKTPSASVKAHTLSAAQPSQATTL